MTDSLRERSTSIELAVEARRPPGGGGLTPERVDARDVRAAGRPLAPPPAPPPSRTALRPATLPVSWTPNHVAEPVSAMDFRLDDID